MPSSRKLRADEQVRSTLPVAASQPQPPTSSKHLSVSVRGSHLLLLTRQNHLTSDDGDDDECVTEAVT